MIKTGLKFLCNLGLFSQVAVLVACSHKQTPTLNPLSQLDYDFVQPRDYRLAEIPSKLRLAAFAEGYSRPPELTPLVIKEDKPTAFSLATGEVILSTGLLTQIKVDAELSAVIAHEYAHKLLNHFKNLQSSNMINMAIEPDLEFAADELSLKLLKNAGYPEIAALKALRSLHRQIRSEVSSEWNVLLSRREENLAAQIGN